jgi:hypothetical protein
MTAKKIETSFAHCNFLVHPRVDDGSYDCHMTVLGIEDRGIIDELDG